MSGLSGVGVSWAFTSFLTSLMTCVGFFMPYWITGQMTLIHPGQSSQTVPVHFGIFRRCNYPAIGDDGKLTMIHECGRYTTFHDIPSISWKISTLTIGVGCILCMLVALTAMFGVCVRGVVIPTVARTAGILQLCSGQYATSYICTFITRCLCIILLTKNVTQCVYAALNVTFLIIHETSHSCISTKIVDL